jgi:hypothetical protein
VAFTAKRAGVARLDPIPLPGRLFAIDGQHDPRPRLSYHLDYGPTVECDDDPAEEIEHDATYHSPQLIAEVVKGRLALDTPAARRVAREACPRPPDKSWRTATEVFCARLWGQSSAALLKQLRARFEAGSCTDAGADQRPSRGPTTEYDPMRTAAEWEPPFRLSA